MPNFEIFEAIRNKKNGGTMIGAHKAVNPILVAEYSEDFELLVVEIQIRNKEIRIISGYGPQESWTESDRIPFFIALESEIAKAELMGKSIIIEMDSNSKLGNKLIPNDPHSQTPNGQLLAGIVERHGLIVANGLIDKCTGVITRRRVTKENIEESVIDHMIISEDLKDDLTHVLIDEEQNHVLNRVTKTKKGIVTANSDHNVIISNFSIPWNTKVKQNRVEMFNLKNHEGQLKFKEVTSRGNSLSSIFNNGGDLNICTKKFIKKLNECIYECFHKVRITERNDPEIEELFAKRKILRSKDDEKSKDELKEVEEKLADKCAEKNYNKIKEEIANIDCEEGGIISGHLWKLKKKISPKCRDPPTGMLDPQGNLITSPKLIEELASQTYAERLKNRPINKDLSELKESKEKLCKIRLQNATKNKTPQWTMEDLEKVLKGLKKNKSRDPWGFANELFQSNVSVNDLKVAILQLMNRSKSEQIFPQLLESVNIPSIFKNKGSRN